MEKYNIIKWFIVSAICLSVISCDNSLDEVVYSSVTEQNYDFSEEDFLPTMLSIYPPLRSLPQHWGFWTTQESTTDEIVMPPTATGWDDGGIYRVMHYHLWNSEHKCIEGMWSWFYEGILLCNNIIEQIESGKIPAPSPTVKEQGLAELRTMRAYYYWMVCDNFGDAPLVTTMEQVLPEKTSRKEIFDFIVNELKTSIPQLNDTHSGEMYGRMNKWAGIALLANVYLNAEVYTGEARWEECIVQCDQIINSGKFELSSNYKDSFRAQGVESSKEVLFTIPFDKVLGAGNIFHMVSWQSELRKKFDLAATPWGSGTSMAITQFIDTYQEGDSRLDDTWLHGQQYDSEGNMLYGIYEFPGEPLNIGKDIPNASYVTEMEGYRMNKYEVEPGTTDNSNTDMPLFRYAQILMMKAECLLRTGQSGAGELVTSVRQRAFKENPEKAVVSNEQLKGNTSYNYGYVNSYVVAEPGNQDIVPFGRMYDELGWEFAWETLRRRDAIRFGVFTKKSWLSHKPQGDYRTVFPIPEKVLISNPKLSQNPNYTK